MRPCRYLGNHAAERLMGLILSDDGLRQNSSVAAYQCDCTVVARRLKAKDDGHFASGPLP